MKRIRYILIILCLLITCIDDILAQDIQSGYVMSYVVHGKDTLYLDDLPPAVINPRKGRRKKMSNDQWTEYYRRVHNFSKAYPYALFVAKTIRETDSLFEARGYSKKQQDRYLEEMKNDLLKDFNPIFRKLTLKQGLMMIRLIDRQVGLTPYYIIKKYLGRSNAGFWQGVAKMFKGNLKQPYDKYGEDKPLEELVQVWESGNFDRLYYSIFGKPRPEIFIPERFK